MPITEEVVEEALHAVKDWESKRSIIELNLIREIRVEGNGVRVVFAPPSPFCPYAIDLGLAIRRTLEGLEDVDQVEVVCQGHMQDGLVNRLVREGPPG